MPRESMKKKNAGGLNYIISPFWNMLMQGDNLIITKGADEIYMIDDLSKEKALLVYNAYKNNKIRDLIFSSDEEIKETARKLEKAGVFYKSKPLKSPKLVRIHARWIGKKLAKIVDILKYFASSNSGLEFLDESEEADCMVIVRTSAKLRDIVSVGNYQRINTPHLLVDIAYDHTISFGPFVFPKETACLGCFIGRITYHWGDAKPPKMPNVCENYELIASLVLEQLKTFQKFGSCPELIEKVWALNLVDWSTRLDNIYRLPWCPFCYPKKAQEGLGSFELPWSIRESQI